MITISHQLSGVLAPSLPAQHKYMIVCHSNLVQFYLSHTKTPLLKCSFERETCGRTLVAATHTT